MAFRFEDRRITKLGELLEFIRMDQELLATASVEGGESRTPIVWYRGNPSTHLNLLPSFHRRKIAVQDEVYLMNRFKQNAHQFVEHRPQGDWEWMLLARHHGLPSRLLDWTENPLVGLFFACNGYNSEHSNRNGVLWCLSPRHLNEIASNGTIGSNLPPMFQDEDLGSPADEFLDNYRPLFVSRPSPSIAPAAAISIRTNKRIQAQLGVFTIHHADTKPVEDWGTGSHLWRYILPSNIKSSIRSELHRAGITSLALFPDLDNAAQEAMRGF